MICRVGLGRWLGDVGHGLSSTTRPHLLDSRWALVLDTLAPRPRCGGSEASRAVSREAVRWFYCVEQRCSPIVAPVRE